MQPNDLQPINSPVLIFVDVDPTSLATTTLFDYFSQDEGFLFPNGAIADDWCALTHGTFPEVIGFSYELYEPSDDDGPCDCGICSYNDDEEEDAA